MPRTAADEVAAAMTTLLAQPSHLPLEQQLDALAEQIAGGGKSEEPAYGLLHVIEGAAR